MRGSSVPFGRAPVAIAVPTLVSHPRTARDSVVQGVTAGGAERGHPGDHTGLPDLHAWPRARSEAGEALRGAHCPGCWRWCPGRAATGGMAAPTLIPMTGGAARGGHRDRAAHGEAARPPDGTFNKVPDRNPGRTPGPGRRRRRGSRSGDGCAAQGIDLWPSGGAPLANGGRWCGSLRGPREAPGACVCGNHPAHRTCSARTKQVGGGDQRRPGADTKGLIWKFGSLVGIRRCVPLKFSFPFIANR